MKRVAILLGVLVLVFGMVGVAGAFATIELTGGWTSGGVLPSGVPARTNSGAGLWARPDPSDLSKRMTGSFGFYKYQFTDTDLSDGAYDMVVTGVTPSFGTWIYLYEGNFNKSATLPDSTLKANADGEVGLRYTLKASTVYYLVITSENTATPVLNGKVDFRISAAPGTEVPIPGAALLLGTGLAGLAGLRRKIKS